MPIPEFPTGPRGTVLVTGASHRVGRAIALELARSGFGLALTYRSREAECHATARSCEEVARAAGHAVRTSVSSLDLGDSGGVVAFAESIRARAGGRAIDAIVHNASVYEGTDLVGCDAASLAHAVESAHRVEVTSPLVLTHALRAELARSSLAGGGAVVLFSDIHALGRARAGFTPYMLAKAAVATLARQLAVELAPAVRVHCVAPGVVLWPEGFPEDTRRAILERTPLARAGTPDEAAKLVRFLITEASYSTGDVVTIDGGRGLR